MNDSHTYQVLVVDNGTERRARYLEVVPIMNKKFADIKNVNGEGPRYEINNVEVFVIFDNQHAKIKIKGDLDDLDETKINLEGKTGFHLSRRK